MIKRIAAAATSDAAVLARAKALKALSDWRAALTTTWPKAKAALTPHSSTIQPSSPYFPSNRCAVMRGQLS